MKKTIIYLFVWMAGMTGCKKFLDINPSTQEVNPSTVSDFEEMLNNDSLSIGNFMLLDIMSDDVHFPDLVRSGPVNFYSNAYLWNEMVWNPADQDYMYNSSYSRILQMNIILSRINTAPADTFNATVRRSVVISQSLIHRSYYYLQLANIYGRGYNSGTAATDLAVPLILSPDVAARPARASVRAVYNQVTGDLKRAVGNPNLPAMGADIIHPGRAAAYAILSRAYLYMADYDSASLYADSALALASTLNDISFSFSGPTQLMDLRTNPEILLGKVAYEQNFYSLFQSAFQISSSLYDLMSYNDGRYNTRVSGYLYQTTSTNGPVTLFSDFSVAVPEVMLTKAECLARSGDAAGAIDLVNRLATNRISYYEPINADTVSNPLYYVLRERRRELFVHGGLRWFDLKRLNSDVLTRQQDDSTVIATLPIQSNRYVVPFTQTVLANNPNIVQNSRQ